MIAALTADRLQQQQRKHVFFEEPPRAGAVCFLPATPAAAKFLEKPAPRGLGRGSHKLPPGKYHFNAVSGAKLHGNKRGLRALTFLAGYRKNPASYWGSP